MEQSRIVIIVNNPKHADLPASCGNSRKSTVIDFLKIIFTLKNDYMQLPGLVQFRQCTLSDNDLAAKVADGLCKMYEPPVSVPTRNIPARPDEDFDLLVGELVVRFLEQTELLKRVDALCADASELIEKQNAALT